MKKIIFILIFLLSLKCGYSQIAYYDANTLASLLDHGHFQKADSDKLFAIFKNYGIDAKSFKNLQKDSDYNPFLYQLFEHENNKLAPEMNLAELNNNVPAATNLIGGIGNLDVTNIANGIAEFMVKRGKEELTIAFFNRFQKFAKQHTEFQILFPKTFNNLSTLLSYSYTEWLPALRTGFYNDLQNIPANIDGILSTDDYKALFKNLPEVNVAIRSIKLADRIKNGKLTVAEGLKEFAAFSELSNKNIENSSIGFKNFASSVKLTYVLSEALRSTDKIPNELGWINQQQFGNLVKKSDTFNIFLGLIYLELKSAKDDTKIQFYYENKQEYFYNIMAKLEAPTKTFENALNNFLSITHDVDSIKIDIQNKKKTGSAISKDDYYNYINSGLNIIDLGFNIGHQFDKTLSVSKYDTIARKANEVYRNIYKQEYPQAILNSVYILNKIMTLANSQKESLKIADKTLSKEIKLDKVALALQDSLSKIEKSKTPIDSNKLKKLKDSLTAISMELNTKQLKLEENTKFINSEVDFSKLTAVITKYGLFIANLINAKSSDEVESLVESAVLPTGSSSIKKNSNWNLSVQSYLGAYVLTKQIATSVNSAWTDKFGVSAPIGLSLSYGLKGWGAVSLFGSLFDIGAIAGYQLKSDSVVNSSGKNTLVTNKNYQINLGQIVSPGAYLVYGFGLNLPLSLGFGYQYGPGLGKINSDGTTVVNNPRGRWGAFLSVDIPLFTFINSSKKNKPSN